MAPYHSVYKVNESRLIPEAKNWTPLRAADRDSYVEQVRRGHDVELVRQGRVIDANTPWVIAVIPDRILNEHQEATGATTTHN